jgi:hypothetical protein
MMTHGRSPLLVLLLLTTAIASCKSAGSGGDVVRPRLSITGIAAADYYPLASGWKWVYSVWKNGIETRALHAVLERRGDVAVVEEGGERITYAITPEGIAEKDGDRLGDYIIKNPITADAEWAVAGGRARIVFVEGRFEDPRVGRYEGCVLIAVTRNDPERVTQTLFAPYLGPVSMDIQAADGEGFVTIAQAQLVGVTRPGDAPATP